MRGIVEFLRRHWVWLTVAGLVAAGGVFWSLRPGEDESAKSYTTVKADRGALVGRVTASGTLSALVTVQVGSQVTGRIQDLYVDFNSVVKKGQVIARIDPRLYEAAVEQARANVAAATGNLTKAKAQAVDAERIYKRTLDLSKQQLVSDADRDTAKANADAADAAISAADGALAQAKAALHQAEINLAYTVIVAPTDGVVISRTVDAGQTVAAALQAPTLFTIARDLSQMQVDTNVAESDVGRVATAMPVTFSVDAWPGQRFHGSVRQIRNAPQTVQNVVTYDAVIDVDNTDQRLKPGMTANVTFIYAQRDSALRVPNAALRFRPPKEMLEQLKDKEGGGFASAAQRPADNSAPANDERSVWVLRGGKPVSLRVKTGISDGSMTEILEGGINAGDDLIIDWKGGKKGNMPPGMGRIL